MKVFIISSKRMPKVSQTKPKGAKRSQKVPKVNQKGATWSPKGAKSEPRGDPNASTNRFSEKVAKREPEGPHKTEMGAFWDSFSIKIRWTNRYGNRSRKNPKIKEKRCENGTTFWWFSELLLMTNWIFQKRCMYENHMIYKVERVSARARWKRRTAKTDEIL